jgi:hypothetical protein
LQQRDIEQRRLPLPPGPRAVMLVWRHLNLTDSLEAEG